MPRPKSPVEDQVFEVLRGYEGDDLHYPATLKTIYAVRNAVYRFNKGSGKRFRCIIGDNEVTFTERPMKTRHGNAAKEITEMLTAARVAEENDVDLLTERVRDILTKHLSEDDDEDVEETTVRRKRA